MQRTEVATPQAPRPSGAYSQGMVFRDLVFVAGQRPADPDTGLVPAGIVAQTRQVLSNVRSVLEAAGSSMDSVLKVTVYLTNLNDWSAMNEVYSQFFDRPLPVRTTVGVALRDILIEVDAIACRSSDVKNLA
jgi:2-iminobutanoate/2-iminopropanoate deaminase